MNRFAIIGESAENLIDPLERRGYKVIVMPRFSMLDFPVCTHPDMLFTKIGRYIITSNAYYLVAKKSFDYICNETGAELILDEASQFSPYPNEARFNVLSLGNIVVGNKNIATPEILGICDKLLYKFVHVNQGYSACSTAKLSGAAISADNGICKALKSNGYNCLKIDEGHIKLENYGFGFIGGASGFDEYSNTLFFNGYISLHSNFNDISAFSSAVGTKIVSLSDGPLVDCGGIVFF